MIDSWIKANAFIARGRKKSGRKIANNTRIERREGNAIAVRLHLTDVVTYYPDGRIEGNTGGWNTITTKDRINLFSPFRIWTESDYPFWQMFGHPETLAAGFSVVWDGETLIGSDDPDKIREQIRDERNERNRPRNRGRYWANKARGIFLDQSGCQFNRERGYYKWNALAREKSYIGCNVPRVGWERRRNPLDTPQAFECGCKVVRRIPSAKGLTVENILAEENATVRTAKMHIYGIGKFFLDARARTIAEEHGYQLLEIPLGDWRNMRAVQMECPSTGEIYINPIPDWIDTIPGAMDWIFDTKDYLKQITQQT